MYLRTTVIVTHGQSTGLAFVLCFFVVQKALRNSGSTPAHDLARFRKYLLRHRPGFAPPVAQSVEVLAHLQRLPG